jgi:hypothetical protein
MTGFSFANIVKFKEYDKGKPQRGAGNAGYHCCPPAAADPAAPAGLPRLPACHCCLQLNNIETDERYARWPKDLQSLLMPTFPGGRFLGMQSH